MWRDYKVGSITLSLRCATVKLSSKCNVNTMVKVLLGLYSIVCRFNSLAHSTLMVSEIGKTDVKPNFRFLNAFLS